MNYEEQYEPEIDLKDLVFYILYKWRSIMAVALVCCVLLSVYKAVRNANLTPEERIPQKVKEYELALARYELDKESYERNILNDSERLEHQQTYMEKSVLMQIDPYHKPFASADLFVKLDSTEWESLPDNLGMDPTDSVIKAYTSGFASILDWTPIEELTGIEEIYLREALSVYADYNSNTFTLNVVYPDGEMAQEILNIVLSQVLDRHTDVAETVGGHTIMMTSKTLTHVIDAALAENQKSNVAAIANYERSILSNRENLEELEKPGEPRVLGFVKYPIAGFILGAFMGILLWGGCYLLDGKLHGERSLNVRYGFPLLGIMPPPERKGFLSGVDRTLDRLAASHSQIGESETYKRIAIAITSLAGDRNMILVTGTINIDKIQAFTNILTSHLKNINLSVVGNAGMNPDAMAAVEKCDTVLLVEERETSYAAEIREERECIRTLGKSVIGYVLL